MIYPRGFSSSRLGTEVHHEQTAFNGPAAAPVTRPTPDGDGYSTEVHTLALPAVTALQEAYVRQVVDTVNDLDNVLYEIANESHGGSDPWQRHLIEYLHAYEAGKPKQHPVLYSEAWNFSNAEIWASQAEAVSPGWGGETGGFI